MLQSDDTLQQLIQSLWPVSTCTFLPTADRKKRKKRMLQMETDYNSVSRCNKKGGQRYDYMCKYEQLLALNSSIRDRSFGSVVTKQRRSEEYTERRKNKKMIYKLKSAQTINCETQDCLQSICIQCEVQLLSYSKHLMTKVSHV